MSAINSITNDGNIRNRFHDPTLLTRTLQCLLATLLVVCVAVFFIPSAKDAPIFGILGVIQLITGVVFFCWIYLANVNARALGASGIETPGWSVGWYFVPIFSFWKPFQAMRQIWNASKNPTLWSDEPTDPILRLWWFGAIATNFALVVGLRAVMVAEVFWISFALVLITRLSRMQIKTRQSRPLPVQNIAQPTNANDALNVNISAEAQMVIEKAKERGWDVRWTDSRDLEFSKGGTRIFCRYNNDVLQFERAQMSKSG